MINFKSAFFLIVVGLLVLINSFINVAAETSYIKVDVKGYVNNPGIVILQEGSRVDDAIAKAGGLLKTADISLINLAKELKDSDVVIVYSREEMKNTNIHTVVKYIDNECLCPEVKNDACLINTSNKLININTANLNELMTIPGIGKVKADSIVKYRVEFGNFMKIEDIMKVKGIGKSTFEKIKDSITI